MTTALSDLRLERVLDIKLGLVAYGSKRHLYLRLDRELDFPPGIVELALLAKHARLDLLGCSQLFAIAREHLLQIGQLLVAGAELVGDRQTRSLGFSFGDVRPLRLQLGRHLLVNGLASFRDFFSGLLE